MSVSNFFSQNTAVSFLKTASAAAQARNESHNKSKNTDPMLEALADSTSDKAKAFNAEQDRLNQTLQQLESSKTSLSDQRKAAAQENIERLKAQLQALRMLASVDPKAAAREAARLSKELSAAVKEYASASGGGADITASTSGAATVTATTQTAIPATEAQAETADATPDAAPAQVAKTPVTSTKDDDRKAFKDKIDAQIAGIQKKAGEIQGDNAFTMEARRIQNELKSILRMAKHKTSHDQSGDDQDIKAAEHAMTETDEALNGMTVNALLTNTAVNITA